MGSLRAVRPASYPPCGVNAWSKAVQGVCHEKLDTVVVDEQEALGAAAVLLLVPYPTEECVDRGFSVDRRVPAQRLRGSRLREHLDCLCGLRHGSQLGESAPTAQLHR